MEEERHQFSRTIEVGEAPGRHLPKDRGKRLVHGNLYAEQRCVVHAPEGY